MESIQIQCISFIINNKLMPKDKIDKYNFLSFYCGILIMDMSKHILFHIFPVVSEIEDMFSKIMKLQVFI